MPAAADVTALIITLKLATLTTLILLLLGTPLAWWLARSQARYKFLLEALVALPLVLPPASWATICWWCWASAIPWWRPSI